MQDLDAVLRMAYSDRRVRKSSWYVRVWLFFVFKKVYDGRGQVVVRKAACSITAHLCFAGAAIRYTSKLAESGLGWGFCVSRLPPHGLVAVTLRGSWAFLKQPTQLDAQRQRDSFLSDMKIPHRARAFVNWMAAVEMRAVLGVTGFPKMSYRGRVRDVSALARLLLLRRPNSRLLQLLAQAPSHVAASPRRYAKT
jgi:hypothetical protein